MTSDSIKTKRLAGVFLLGCMLFNYPLLSLFAIKRIFLDIPLFYLYIFSVWSGLILLLIVVTHRSTAPSSKPPIKKK